MVLLEKTETDKINAAERMKAVQLQKELQESECSLLKLDEKYQLILDEKLELSQTLEELRYENNALESKVKCSLEDIRTLEGQASSEREKAEEMLHSEIGKAKEQLSREKRRSEAYKSKAIDAHRRSVEAKEVLDSICTSKV